MVLVTPQFAVFDTATLSKVSRDYWSADDAAREKARTWLDNLAARGVHVVFTCTHIFELLRYADKAVVLDRLAFLRKIPLIAWLRPYSGAWFPGGLPDLLCRELHEVMHASQTTWEDVIASVRSTMWETGVGSEMFVEDDFLWAVVREEAKRQHAHEKYVASIARTDPGRTSTLTLREAQSLPRRPRAEWQRYVTHLGRDLHQQMVQHGDKRMEYVAAHSAKFAVDAFKRVESLDPATDMLEQMRTGLNIPEEFISLDMTIGEFGALGVYAKQLQILGEGLMPPIALSMRDVPPDTLPSHVLEKRLSAIQRRSARVSGSDLGDGFIAPLVLYADRVEVDKRTHEYLNQVRRMDPRMGVLMKPYFSCPKYERLPDKFNTG